MVGGYDKRVCGIGGMVGKICERSLFYRWCIIIVNIKLGLGGCRLWSKFLYVDVVNVEWFILGVCIWSKVEKLVFGSKISGRGRGNFGGL